MTRREKAAATRKRNAEWKIKSEAIHAETQAIVTKGECPRCGSGLRRNNSLAGWWQCEQYGAEQFRTHPQDPPCEWQGFTE